MKPLKTWTVQALKKEYQGLYCSIYEVDCYGSKDLLWLSQIEQELGQRGYEIYSEHTTFKLAKWKRTVPTQGQGGQ